MSVSDRPVIPVTVISGFLGAGKTTWLNRLISDGGLPADSLILVNDFGSINIDAELIEYQSDRILRLSNGCICCTLGGTLADQLAGVLRKPGPLAAIYIEASGIADPARIADIARVSGQLQLKETLCLIDASQYRRYSTDERVKEVWHAQIRSATKLLLNRTGQWDRQQLRTTLQQLNANAEIIFTAERQSTAETETAEIAAAIRKPAAAATGASVGLTSFSVILERPLCEAELESLFSEYRDVLLRAKGIIRTEAGGRARIVQLSGGTLSWWPAPEATGCGQLVCIGSDGERFDALKSALT